MPWVSQPGPQREAIRKAYIEELFYGGAVGGGKSDFLLGDFAQDVPRCGGAWQGILFRRTYPELSDLVRRSQEIYPPWFPGVVWHESDKEWRWPNGSILRMRYLESVSDYMRYWGHAYCVGVGTPILMADGGFKAIEEIGVGDSVMTLEGAKPVTDTLNPYVADCVKIKTPIGTQIQPTSHPIMLSASEWGSYASLTGDRTCSGASYDSHPNKPQLQAWSGHATLYEPLARSAGSCRETSMTRHTPCISQERSLGTMEGRSPSSSRLSRIGARARQFLDYGASLFSTFSPSYAYAGAGHASLVRGYPANYRGGFHCDGEQPHQAKAIAQSGVRLQGDAEKRGRESLSEDGKGCIPSHSHEHQSSWYIHPYTKARRPLEAQLESGTVSMVPVGAAWVCDITVADANHYISACGIINKNTWIGWDELPTWSSMEAYHRMKARLRSASEVPFKRIRATGNPGGPSHHEVKHYFGIDKYPLGSHPIMDDASGMRRMFIRSRLQDNQILLKHDPSYGRRLQGLGSETLVRAWLEGDWSIVAGAFFTEFDLDRHVVRPFEIPAHWSRIRSCDWGSAKPFSVGWYAVSDGSLVGIPRGCLVKYREWYGMKEGQHNVGLKLTAEEVAQGILDREKEKIDDEIMDPAAFAQDGGPSIAERMARLGVRFREADNKRVARLGALGGWDQLRARLKGTEDGPMIMFFSTCEHTIRTIPALQHDELKPEDVDTESEDHAGDETRYACMSRPITHDAPNVPAPKFPLDRTFNELVSNITRKRREAEE